MNNNVKRILIAGMIAFAFILLTFVGSFYTWIPGISDACFVFHIIPFGQSFSGGPAILNWIYYLVLWLVLTGLIALIGAAWKHIRS